MSLILVREPVIHETCCLHLGKLACSSKLITTALAPRDKFPAARAFSRRPARAFRKSARRRREVSRRSSFPPPLRRCVPHSSSIVPLLLPIPAHQAYSET